MKKIFASLFLVLISIAFADSDTGCSISGIIQTPKRVLLESKYEKNCTKVSTEEPLVTGITSSLMSVKVYHENKEVVIERKHLKGQKNCPPFCIEPMSVKNVISVAELEVLAFIKKVKKTKLGLLIDVRESSFYVKGTIPSAINLPFSMLNDGSRYQKEVLKLLGGKLSKINKWSFENAQSLLLFGESITTSEASSSVKKLLELGYPSSHLLYYRAGISSWKALGLTIY